MCVIKIRELSKDYITGKIKVEALKQLNLEVKAGEYIAIMGPSGSGKSTLLNILGCLDRPTSGTYELDKIDVSKLDDYSLAKIRNKKVGFVFQTFNLLPRLDALKNVELPLVYAGIKSEERHKKSKEILKKVGLSDRIHHLPSELSGGQRQKVAIARALINSPAIILADEPTGNLDSKSGEEIMNILDKLNEEGKTILIVTHEKYIAEHAHKIIQLKDGEIVKSEYKIKKGIGDWK